MNMHKYIRTEVSFCNNFRSCPLVLVIPFERRRRARQHSLARRMATSVQRVFHFSLEVRQNTGHVISVILFGFFHSNV